MSELKGANVTKYDAGGSGDNVVDDGFIKTVEKVWIDSYTFSSALATADTLEIAKVQAGKKVTSIKLVFSAELTTSGAGTGTTISLGTEDEDGTTDSTLFLDAGNVGDNLVMEANAGLLQDNLDNGENTIYATFGREATTTTGGTIYSIVRYT